MKHTFATIVFLFAAYSAQAQKPPVNERGEPADQQTCYQQARQYLSDVNKDVAKPDKEAILSQAHYDPKTKMCYAQIERTFSVFPSDSKYRSYVQEIRVVDAFEGKMIAMYVTAYSVEEDGTIKWSDPTACTVAGEKCTKRPVFNGLLWKLIPAFKPVDANRVN